MREVGCEHCTINAKCDQEEAMKSLVTDVGKWRAEGGGQQMNVEHSPLYSSSSNGVVERAIQGVEGHVRVLRSALEERWGVKLDPECALWPWMVEFASVQLNLSLIHI